MKRYFITGTDTNSGKTFVTCLLLRYFQKKNQKTLAIKPIASGCFLQDDQLVNEEVQLLQHYNGNFPHTISPWLLSLPLSPHLAARHDGQHISIKKVIDFCNAPIFSHLDYLFIEGAGGLIVPLNSNETWVDFLTASQIPVILVVGMRLGCLNHALLTDLALRSYHIDCVGWIANCLDKNMLALQENIQTLAKKMTIPLLAIIPASEQNVEDWSVEELFKDLTL